MFKNLFNEVNKLILMLRLKLNVAKVAVNYSAMTCKQSSEYVHDTL